MEHEGKGLKAANAEGERISGFTVERQVGGLGSAGLKVQGADCTQSAVSEDGESVALMVAGSWMRLVSLLLKLQVDRKMEACLVAHESPAKDAAVQSSPTSRAPSHYLCRTMESWPRSMRQVQPLPGPGAIAHEHRGLVGRVLRVPHKPQPHPSDRTLTKLTKKKA